MPSNFIRKEAIEGAVRNVLSKYGKKYAPITEPPVPVDAIAEGLMGLHIAYDDLGNGVLGAINFEKQIVFINTALDPDENKREEGRHNFTLAHELGHWELHRCDFLLPDPGMVPNAMIPKILCRSSQRKEPREVQADMFAGLLLMPRGLMKNAWQQEHGGRVLQVKNLEAFKRGEATSLQEQEYLTLVRDFARLFAVSATAMCIRLADMCILSSVDR